MYPALKKGLINLSKTHVAYIDDKLNLHILNINMIRIFMNKIVLNQKDWKYIITNINDNI